jgi:Ca-activated chloride channel family protein
MELDQVVAPANRNLERYLLLTIRAPKVIPPQEAAPPGKKHPPLNFAPVLDVSGSMQGEKIHQAKEAVRQSIRCLREGDTFSLVTFSNEVKCPFEPQDVDSRTTETVENALIKIGAGGMTALSGGLEMGIANAARFKKDNNLVLLLSDGQANVGETDLEKVGQRAWQARQEGLVVSTLGVGMDYNEALMAEIATQGGGRFYHIANMNKIPAFVAGELGEVANLAGREVRIQLTIPGGATLVPLSAAYPVRQAGEQAEVTVGDIPCDTELEIPLRVAILSQPAGTKLSLEGVLEFQSPAGHTIVQPVNRVTVRFVEAAKFQVRDGVVLPVAEQVFAHMKTASVLSFSRAMAIQPAKVEEQRESVLAGLRTYADLLGEGRAEKEFFAAQDLFAASMASPAAAKAAVADAHRSMRGGKDFNQ